MDVVHVGLVHCDPCKCKVKSFCAVSSIKRNVSMRHLQGVRHALPQPWMEEEKIILEKMRHHKRMELELMATATQLG